METIEHKLANWPKSHNGCVVFKDNLDVVFYALLIYKLPRYINSLRKHAIQLRLQVRVLVDCEEPDMNFLFELACQAHFCMECLEEIQRLKDTEYLITGGGL